MNLENIHLGNTQIAFAKHMGQVVFPSPILDDLVLWDDSMGIKNTDASRAIAEDLSGIGNNGQLMNFAFTESSGYLPNGNGRRYDGIDDYIDYGNILNMGLGDMTFSITCNISGTNTTEMALVSKSLNGSAAPRYLFGIINRRARIFFQPPPGFPVFSVNGAGSVLQDGDYHLVFVIKRNENIKYYINSVLDYTSASISDSQSADMISDTPFRIGAFTLSNGSPYRSYNSGILSVIANRKALTQEEITHNYEMEKTRWGL